MGAARRGATLGPGARRSWVIRAARRSDPGGATLVGSCATLVGGPGGATLVGAGRRGATVGPGGATLVCAVSWA